MAINNFIYLRDAKHGNVKKWNRKSDLFIH